MDLILFSWVLVEVLFCEDIWFFSWLWNRTCFCSWSIWIKRILHWPHPNGLNNENPDLFLAFVNVFLTALSFLTSPTRLDIWLETFVDCSMFSLQLLAFDLELLLRYFISIIVDLLFNVDVLGAMLTLVRKNTSWYLL